MYASTLLAQLLAGQMRGVHSRDCGTDSTNMYLFRGVALISKVLCGQRVDKVEQSLQGSMSHSLRMRGV